ncbi:hypothetical protein OR1_03992 [Geobacter sp. OR-1]|nr:hypothetical protein OR1_03992 [Geobacter sp. OR-1]
MAGRAPHLPVNDMRRMAAGCREVSRIGRAGVVGKTGRAAENVDRRRVAVAVFAAGPEAGLVRVAAGTDIFRVRMVQPAVIIAAAVIVILGFAVADLADPVRAVVFGSIVPHGGAIGENNCYRIRPVGEQILVHRADGPGDILGIGAVVRLMTGGAGESAVFAPVNTPSLRPFTGIEVCAVMHQPGGIDRCRKHDHDQGKGYQSPCYAHCAPPVGCSEAISHGGFTLEEVNDSHLSPP